MFIGAKASEKTEKGPVLNVVNVMVSAANCSPKLEGFPATLRRLVPSNLLSLTLTLVPSMAPVELESSTIAS